MADKSIPNNPDFDQAKSVHEFSVVDLKGEHVKLDKYAGNVCVIVNTATKSRCTDMEYKQFNQLIDKYGKEGLRILAFPCNQFDNEEPCSSEEIAKHAQEHNVKFDIFAKVEVNGINATPFYKFLKKHAHDKKHGDVIKTNYTKFLINKEGIPIERFRLQTSIDEMEKAVKVNLELVIE